MAVPATAPNMTSVGVAPIVDTDTCMRTSLSHSCGVQGCPCQVNENGSVLGTPDSAMSFPAVRCQ